MPSEGFWKIFWVLINGVAFNFLLAIVLFFVMGLFQGRPVDNTIVAFIATEGDYPAINSEIKVGDEITKVNGVEVESYYDFNVEVNAKEGKDKYKCKRKRRCGRIGKRTFFFCMGGLRIKKIFR